ncbi:APC family permease [Curtobacterium sp. MCSS17_005]|uniref:APC family permease n=1 Tax=Curtobacterium sp. MCSS17_005 TaxID=2175641 RepID=UPI000DA8670D|nr:APC family permease [Curtobacterium sp. MCSS17_005]WIB32941.1 APC family permease [Curtobacterium sp. MCSS17_005]
MSSITKDPASLGAVPAPQRTMRGSLGVTAIVFMVVAAAAPLTVVGGAAPLGMLLGNGVGFPSLYAASAVILLLFSVGLAAMTRHLPRPGAFFTFVGHGLGRPAGAGAATLALLTYTTIQVSVHGYIGYLLGVTVTGLGGPDIPWYVWSLVVVALVGVLGYRHIDLSSKVLGVLLVGEAGIVLVLVAAIVFRGGADGLSLAPFEPTHVMSGSPGVGLMFAIAAFIGFEATAIFRDEAKDPERTIPRATYTAVIGIGVFYTLASWGLVMAWGPDGVLAEAAKDPGALILTTAARYIGTAGEAVMNVLLLTSMFACVLSFHNVITRYQHSMANASLLPGRLGTVHRKHESPHTSSVVQTVTAAVLMVLFAALGLDPVLQVFSWFAGVATLGVAILMAATSLAVIVYFRRNRADRRIWNTVIAPVLGFVGLVASAVLIWANFPTLVGDVDGSGASVFGVVSTVLTGLVVVVPAVGVLQAVVLRRRDRRRYDQMLDRLASDG